MHALITHGLAVLVGLCGGYYAHYRWGSLLAADLAKVKSVV